MTRRIDRAGRIAARALVSGLDLGADMSERAEMLVEFASGDVELLRRARGRLTSAALDRPTPLAAAGVAALTAAITRAESSTTSPPEQAARVREERAVRAVHG